MAKKSHKPDELNAESTDEKSISIIDNEKINDISTKEDEKVEIVVDELSESSNKNIETESVDEINDTKETIVDNKKSSDNSQSHNSEKDFQFHEEITYTSKEIEDLTKTYVETLPVIEDKQVLDGTVVRINDKVVVVDINFKSDGVINASEFKYNKELKIGDSVEVLVEQQEDSYGQLKLSHRRARILQAWKKVNIALETGEIVNGQIKSRTKGGMIVDVFGIECFLPGSQIDVKPIRDYEEYVGKEMQFKVVKVNESFRNVVVSHKALIEADLVIQTKEIMSKLEKGQVLEGTVKNITSYGVFVDLGGID